jgi:hypothetical protein
MKKLFLITVSGCLLYTLNSCNRNVSGKYEDALIANIDYFFADTLDIPDIHLDLLKEDYLLEVSSSGHTFRIKYKGGKPYVDSGIIMDSIAKELHNHLESNLNYFYYNIGTNNGEPIIDFINSKSVESTRYLAGSLKYLPYFRDSYVEYMKQINDYDFRVKKYKKQPNDAQQQILIRQKENIPAS